MARMAATARRRTRPLPDGGPVPKHVQPRDSPRGDRSAGKRRRADTLFAKTFHLVVGSAQQSVWAESADDRQAELLAVAGGTPPLGFRRTSSAGHVAVEHNLSWCRGDRYQVHMSLNRSRGQDQSRSKGGGRP
jgi:hypothetical protein